MVRDSNHNSYDDVVLLLAPRVKPLLQLFLGGHQLDKLNPTKAIRTFSWAIQHFLDTHVPPGRPAQGAGVDAGVGGPGPVALGPQHLGAYEERLGHDIAIMRLGGVPAAAPAAGGHDAAAAPKAAL